MRGNGATGTAYGADCFYCSMVQPPNRSTVLPLPVLHGLRQPDRLRFCCWRPSGAAFRSSPGLGLGWRELRLGLGLGRGLLRQHLAPDARGGAQHSRRIAAASRAAIVPSECGGHVGIPAQVHLQHAHTMTHIRIELTELGRIAAPSAGMERHDLHQSNSAGPASRCGVHARVLDQEHPGNEAGAHASAPSLAHHCGSDTIGDGGIAAASSQYARQRRMRPLLDECLFEVNAIGKPGRRLCRAGTCRAGTLCRRPTRGGRRSGVARQRRRNRRRRRFGACCQQEGRECGSGAAPSKTCHATCSRVNARQYRPRAEVISSVPKPPCREAERLGGTGGRGPATQLVVVVGSSAVQSIALPAHGLLS